MAITVEIFPTISNITKNINPKINMLKLPKVKKSKESKNSEPTNYRNKTKKYVTL